MKNDALVKGQWSIEKANEWYDSNPWIRGFSGYPSNCVNRIAFWQEYNHKEVFEQIENEFALSKETGFNAVRAIIQFEVWCFEHDSSPKRIALANGRGFAGDLPVCGNGLAKSDIRKA